ncbi:MAG: hypothetical protein K2Q07_09955 [Burkholderiaceae bacterium]|nr:hypothetical protein [Burkholderiaceae bacterium]
MSTIDWPEAILPASWDWGVRKAGTQFRGPFNGTSQAVDFVADRWLLTIGLPPKRRGPAAGAVRALLNHLAGGVNRVRVWDVGSGLKRAPGEPCGTMRGTPVLFSGAARGDAQLVIGTDPFVTLLAGDMLGCGGQLFQVRSDCAANNLGVITVPLVLRVRGTIAGATAVVWYRPTAEFCMPSFTARHATGPTHLLPSQFDLEEVY